MRAPNQAEVLPPIPNTDTSNYADMPRAVDAAPSPWKSRFMRIAGAILATTSLAGFAHGSTDTETPKTTFAPASNVTLEAASQPAREAANVYTGRVTIRAPRVTATAAVKTAREPYVADSDVLKVAKIMGIPAANVTEGKNATVSIAGHKVNLAHYASDQRVARDWRTTKDCAWNWAVQDLLVASKAAGLNEADTRSIASSPKAISKVVQGYLDGNPRLKQDPRHFLNKGVGYKARHARDQADILVSSMRSAQDPDTQKPEAVQPQPDSYKPKHAAETSNHTESQADKNKSVAIAALKLGGLILTGSILVVGAGMGIGALRRRHRRRQEERAFEQANNHSPDPNDPTTATPSDFSDLREITKQDEQRGYDPVDPPTGAHAATEVRPSPFAPPVEATPSPSKPIQGRARFATPTRPVEPHTRGPRHLRSVSDLSAPIPDLFTRDNRPLGRAESAPETRINDAPTDPASATVLPFPPRKPPLRGRGQVGTDGYIGLHRKITNDAGEVVVPRIQTLRPLAAAAV